MFNKRILTDVKQDDNFKIKDLALDIRKNLAVAPFEINDPKLIGNHILDTKIDLDKKIISVSFNYNNVFENVQLKCSEDMFIIITKGKSNFYIRDVVNPPYILVVLDEYSQERKISFEFLGNLLSSIVDKVHFDSVIRKDDKTVTKFSTKNKQIVSVTRKIDLKPISKNLFKKVDTVIENTKLGVIDLELAKPTSYKGAEFVYAAGIYTYNHIKPDNFYIDSETRDSNKLICNMLDTMFKYDVDTYYCHNLANYDIF